MGQLRRLRATTTVLVAMTAILAMTVTAAFAQYPPDTAFGVTCQPQEPEPGGNVDCVVEGAQAQENLHATARVNPVIYEESMQADENGRADFDFGVPEDLDEGDTIVVTVVGEESGTASDEVEVEEEVDEDDERVADEDERAEAIEAPADDEDRLPVTGGQIVLLGLVGLGLVGGGALALRKRGTSVA